MVGIINNYVLVKSLQIAVINYFPLQLGSGHFQVNELLTHGLEAL